MTGDFPLWKQQLKIDPLQRMLFVYPPKFIFSRVMNLLRKRFRFLLKCARLECRGPVFGLKNGLD
ncbi:hypothetical protein Xkoz_00013 [Xenorhabdus kozodoii]|uniref:Uncharacterized protein n=1 Tax=Xenorhabdus kozodoii TaxID=351676 RepID=A0A2D0LH77_9GAMM|nr:hypothetical protein Xkoz_03236 [Xenorhabdus kozodoii]PHM75005.1 hypothetical protein Xkoz_00013 [Xenorhabdus kozodoii]